MNWHGLSCDEMNRLLRACAHVSVPERPISLFQRYLVGRLHRAEPELSNKIAQLDSEHWCELCRDLRDIQGVAATV